MPISGLILTLSEAPDAREQTFRLLREQKEIEVGTLAGRWLPLVMETSGDDESRQLHDWLTDLPGVAFVDVVAVGFDEPKTAPDIAASPASVQTPQSQL